MRLFEWCAPTLHRGGPDYTTKDITDISYRQVAAMQRTGCASLNAGPGSRFLNREAVEEK